MTHDGSELNVSSATGDLNAIVTAFTDQVVRRTAAFQEELKALAGKAMEEVAAVMAKQPVLDLES